jgi:class 3 adenylate cyclase
MFSPEKNSSPNAEAAASAEIPALGDKQLATNSDAGLIGTLPPTISDFTTSIVFTGRDGTVSQLWTSQYQSKSWEDCIARLLGERADVDHSGLNLRLTRDAAVLTVDLVDSTGFLREVERHGESPGEALDSIFARIAASLKPYGAHFATVGDGLTAVFSREPAAWDAINFAYELQESYKREQIGSVRGPEIRVGLAYGRVELQPLGIDGQARVVGFIVNTAFHAASGKGQADVLPDFRPGCSIYVDPSFRERLAMPGLMAKAA